MVPTTYETRLDRTTLILQAASEDSLVGSEEHVHGTSV